ncbi:MULTISPECIES: chaplin family protein [Streptomyces]
MRQVIGKGMLATAAATSILSLSGSNAIAAGADGVTANSPGILSGNSVQAPVEVPVNACGNSANAVAVGNPAMGNGCANAEAPQRHEAAPERASGTTHGDRGYGDQGSQGDQGYGDSPDRDAHPGTHAGTQAQAQGTTSNSPGILSGNSAQAPLDIPVNACGNTVDVVGLLNPAMGNECANGAPTPPQPETPVSPETPPRTVEPPTDRSVPPVKHASPPQQVDSSIAREVPTAAHRAPHAVAQLAETGSDQNLLAAGAAAAALLVGGGILYRRGLATSGR